jgi:hypothetical protein
MKKIVLFLLSVLFIIAPVSFGYCQQQSTNFVRMYNPNTETLLKGKITDIQRIPMGRTRNYGIHLVIDNNKTVHLGPSWYINEQEVQLSEGDQVEILGSEVDYDGEDVIIARRVVKNGMTLLLRNENGIPRWSRGRMNRG